MQTQRLPLQHPRGRSGASLLHNETRSCWGHKANKKKKS